MSEENTKYEEIVQELEEYKKLLWQLSDEYKINVTAAEKKLEEEINKRQAIEYKLKRKLKTEEKTISTGKNSDFSFISSLGLPACIIDNEGKIKKFNNKLKFLIEILFLEIEDITTIQKLVVNDKTQNLTNKINKYFSDNERLFQSLFKVENSFQNQINLVFRIYNYDNENHIVFLLELNKHEIESLSKSKEKVILEKNEEQNNNKIDKFSIEISNFSEKYEIEADLLKNIKDLKNPDVKKVISKSFDLNTERKNIYNDIISNKTEFISKIEEKYPDLTSNEIKQCILIKEGLTYKEISAIMNISVSGVKIARNRLRKKLDLDNKTKTQDFIDSI